MSLPQLCAISIALDGKNPQAEACATKNKNASETLALRGQTKLLSE
jgi:hypothetical protein